MNVKFYFIINLFLLNNIFFLAAAEHKFNILTNGEKREIILTLSDSAWEHITEGKKTDDGFSGGHDWGKYYENHLKHDLESAVYFDTNSLAYIVESRKGDSLIEIITKLKERKDLPKYHTLFPAGILTKEFIFKAFKKAYLNHFLKNEKHIDFPTQIFYIEIDNFKVAGFFEQEGDKYAIKTCFPDLSWYYRIDFKHHKDDPFQLERFLRYHRNPSPNCNDHAWVQHGVAREKALTTQNNHSLSAYWPTPLIALSLNLRGKEGQHLNLSDFILQENLDEFLRTKFTLEQNPPHVEEIFEFLFDEPQNPSIEEINHLVILLDMFINEFNIKFKKQDNPKRRLILVKNELSRRYKNNGIFFKHLKIEDNNQFSYSKVILNHSEVEKGFHFAEQFLINMMTLQKASYFVIPEEESKFLWIPISKKFYVKFQDWLLQGGNFQNELKNQNWMFDLSMVKMTKKVGENQKSLVYLKMISTTDITTLDSMSNDRQSYRLLLNICSPKDNLFSLKFSDTFFYQSR
jgi:hypothetical protein